MNSQNLSLSAKQRVFSWGIGQLLSYIYNKGYSVTFGEAFRSDEQAAINALGKLNRSDLVAFIRKDDRYRALAAAIDNNGNNNGIATSLHQVRLAVDFNLFDLNGEFLQNSEDHRQFGDFWKTLHPDFRWGGDFSTPDGNHYSMEHEGRK